MEDRTDAELVALARKGDKDAFGLLVQRYRTVARRLATRWVANEDCVQDMVQEASLQAYLLIDHLRDPAKFKSWFCGIVSNICRNYLRNQKVNFFSLEALAGGLRFDAVPYSGTVVNPEKRAEEQELHRVIIETIHGLAEKERDAVLHFYYDQLSVYEIATREGISVSAVKVRLHRARRQLRAKFLSNYPEIIPYENRRKIMVRVTIADVVKRERTDKHGWLYSPYVIVLRDETGNRALPIWIGTFEGQSIASILGDISFPRPMTFHFFASLLKAVNAKVEHVRVEALKEDTYYGIVRIHRGKTVKEVDARPSDAIALALLIGSPIFVAEEVLERAGIDIPQPARAASGRKGLGSILKEFEETKLRSQAQQPQLPSKEEITRAAEELIAAVFGS